MDIARIFLADTLEEVKAGKLRGGVPDIRWTTEYAQLVQDLPNCYAEIGTTWASSVVMQGGGTPISSSTWRR